MSRKTYYRERFLAIVAAIILLQTLYYKFTGHSDSIYIFSLIGIEPQGRIVVGVIELITALLLLYARTAVFGAMIGICIMFGAIIYHFLVLGIEIRDDGGTLFILALVTFFCCLYILFSRSDQLYSVYRKIIGEEADV